MNRKLKMLAVMLFISATAFAQEVKIGYTSIDLIVFNMPEMVQINADLNVYQSQLASQVNTKNVEIENKMSEYQVLAQQSTTTQVMLQERQNEIVGLQQALQDFSKKAEEAFNAKQTEAYQPVYTRVQTAIAEIRKEKGYLMILNSRTVTGAQVILAADEADDITEEVFKKLGVELPKPEAAAADTTGTGN